ncbi:MAG: hypothetical protein DI523_10295, partial [Paraburkholderia fungorum]
MLAPGSARARGPLRRPAIIAARLRLRLNSVSIRFQSSACLRFPISISICRKKILRKLPWPSAA